MCNFCNGGKLFRRMNTKEGYNFLGLCLFQNDRPPIRLVCCLDDDGNVQEEKCDEEGRMEIVYCPICGEKIKQPVRDIFFTEFKRFLYAEKINGCDKLCSFTAKVDGKEHDMLIHISDDAKITILSTDVLVTQDEEAMEKIRELAIRYAEKRKVWEDGVWKDE